MGLRRYFGGYAVEAQFEYLLILKELGTDTSLYRAFAISKLHFSLD